MKNQLYPFSFYDILSASPIGFLVCGSHDEILPNADPECFYANNAAHQLTGVSDFEGFTLKSICGAHFDFNTLRENNSLNFQFNKSGIWCKIDKSVIDEEYNLYTLTDISAEKNVEAQLAYLQKLSAEAEETMEFGSWIWDIQNARYEWTEGMYKLMGYGPESLPIEKLSSATFKKNIHPDDVALISEKLKNVLSYTDAYILEFRIIAEDGEEKYLYVRGHNSIDEITGHNISIGTAFNVTTLREIQSELERKVKDLNKSNEDLEEFAYVASHDLQEPLRKIISFGERLESKTKDILDKEQEVYLSRILSATRRMQKMINNLLEFSRVTSSSNVFEPTDLNDILGSTLSDLEVTIQQKQAVLKIDKLPVIDANPTQMSQLFINLISNSLKFTKPDTAPVISLQVKELTVSEALKRKMPVEKKYIKITLKDNGIGFSNENASRIFTIFQRLRGRSEFEGAGIGLSVCKKVVESHHGIIEAFGIPDQGATFEIILPVSQN
ncbi:ATP-binding protein [Dyadobacter subterraneus]|uniref:histidine kinase n=1 Tax=Dyadobacter subterraneus TaxID=2773304 RepID=A0ABR9WHE3_9BACT|nr:PAS domain-containing sensor histidine kinase [Dyadobacter subterraneus]MBE9464915.1 PAS domain-containing protein [Dyadobacter subterraneus]